jgi:NAD(P)-dependent dehydrogenase (short-subunit alcohol dehydrogenase family)
VIRTVIEPVPRTTRLTTAAIPQGHALSRRSAEAHRRRKGCRFHASPNAAMSPHDLATMQGIVDERLWGLIFVVQHAAPRISQGSINLTSGSLSSRPRPGTAMLSAVEALAPALPRELAPVRVIAITPGLIITPLLHTAYGPERDTIIKNRAGILPGKRVGTADEVAQVILMLMTHDDLTGEVVHVDGGGRIV